MTDTTHNAPSLDTAQSNAPHERVSVALKSTAPAQKLHRSNFDWPSLFAFTGASTLGVASVINTVHEAFHKKFICVPRSREKTIYTDLYEDYYLDKVKPPSAEAKDALKGGAYPHEVQEKVGKIQENARKFGAGLIDKKTYMDERRSLTREFRSKCDLLGKEKLGIPCKGVARWTVGTIKKMRFLADTVQNQAFIGFGTVALVGIGAVLVLKHSRGVLDDIQNKLDKIDDRNASR